jgi:DNA mismatch repair protein MutS2
MERDLDRMVRSGIHSAVIIHGHGTGALKEAVRAQLGHSSYVSDFRSGEYGEGGDGVSIAILRE